MGPHKAEKLMYRERDHHLSKEAAYMMGKMFTN